MIPSKHLTLEAMDPLNTGWNNTEDRKWGTDRSITTNTPYFPSGSYSPEPLAQVCDAVFNSSTDEMQNIAPLATAPPHIPLPPPSRNQI